MSVSLDSYALIFDRYVGFIAPACAFVAVALFFVGLYRTLNHGGLLARRRIAAFAPGGVSGTVGMAQLDGPALLAQKRFSSIRVLDRMLQRKDFGLKLARKLALAGLPLKVGEYLLLRFALGAFLAFMGWLLGLAAVIVLGLGCAGYAAPALYVQRRRQARLRQFEDQLVDALTLIANALKSGYSFLQGIEAVAREMPPPLGAEFEQVVREIRVGGSAEEALLKLCERVPSQDLELVVTAMIIQRQVGGNLADILSNIAYTVRERHRILREIRVLTAQERMSGNVVAGIPLALVLLMSITTPTYLSGMWATNAGKAMLGAGFVMELIGLLVIRRMVELEV